MSKSTDLRRFAKSQLDLWSLSDPFEHWKRLPDLARASILPEDLSDKRHRRQMAMKFHRFLRSKQAET